jgi:hypothetical protein
MLLRTIALTLLLLNGLYWAWSQELLAPIGLAPASVREPQRLEQQIRPEALRVLSPQEAAAVPADAAPGAAAAPVTPAPTACWQAGPFDLAQAEGLRRSLYGAGLPSGSWALEPIAPSERWIVYMGRYADAEALDKKRAELRALRVDTAPVTQASLAPGLSLGVFSTREAAAEQLAQVTRRGVRTARVVPDPREASTVRLRLPAADAALLQQAQQLGPALGGRTLQPC